MTASKFLSSKEVNPNTIEYYYEDTRTSSTNRAVISCVNTSFSWDEKGEIPALKELDINLEPKSITMIIGETGSGKSALLQGLLGNLHKTSGSIYYNHKEMEIAYSSQTAWIQNATIKENILFGHKLNELFYQNVVSMCALEDDLKIFPAGDETEIGEKGVNLSGGQKQRLSLARAVYSNADIYLFDDPLSAVDSHVANHIFTECIINHLLKRGKTVILTTHAIGFLEHADNIIVMENGKVSVQGKLKDLIAANVNLVAHSRDNDAGKDKQVSPQEKSTLNPQRKKEGQSKRLTAPKGQLVQKEKRGEGRVSLEMYRLYAREAYGPFLLGCFVTFAGGYLVVDNILSVYWLADWSDSIREDGTTERGSWWYLRVYIGLKCIALLLMVIQIVVEIISRLKAAKLSVRTEESCRASR